jgi:adenylate cyclase
VIERMRDFQGRPVGNVLLRGRSEPLAAYEPMTAERHCHVLTAEYLAAYSRMEACDATALPAFAALLGRDSSDGLVGFHLKRLLAGASGIMVALE